MKYMIIYCEKDLYEAIKKNNVFAGIVQKVGGLGHKEQGLDGGVSWKVRLPKNNSLMDYMLKMFGTFGTVEAA